MSRTQRVLQRKINQSRKKLNTITKGYPSANEGHDGQETIRWVDGKGLFYFVKYNGTWYSHQFNQAPVISNPEQYADDNLIYADGRKDFTAAQSHGGNNVTNVGELSGASATFSGNVAATGTLDVNGHTTLDRTTIDTTDGAFSVSGANPSNIVATGSNDVSLVSGGDINLTSTNDLDIDANTITVDTTRTVDANIGNNCDITSEGNITIEAHGVTSAPKTLNNIGGKNDFTKVGNVTVQAYNKLAESGTDANNQDANGIHIKTDAGNTASKYNNILIEQTNQHSKGSSYGVDIKSANNIRLRAENNNANQATSMLMRATGPIDIGVGSSITPHTSNNRVKVHGIFETGNLWRNSDAPIVMDKGTIEGGSATQEYTKFEALDTQKLIRAYTYKANATTAENDYLTIVPDASADEVNGTVWLVTVVFNNGVNEGITSGYCYRMNNTVEDPEDHGYLIQSYNSTGNGGKITWSASNGIRWQNIITGSIGVIVKASAQRLQSGNDF